HNVPGTDARLPGSGSARAWAAVANTTGRRCSSVAWCSLTLDSADRAARPGTPTESTVAPSGTCSPQMRGPRDGLGGTAIFPYPSELGRPDLHSPACGTVHTSSREFER